ncbi:MAG: formate-dependent phosphoribosylglycinamide formyltransferase [Spirochaetia bacterium]|nr:formate-dependent phosphoribosylglycinamide formyltransferase [Spirochaetia bacterium]
MQIGTPRSANSLRLMLLGSGELGKEVAIEAQRLGVHVIAVDRYANAPAMQVAHESYVINMLDGSALRTLIETHRPALIVPEIEAIATDTLLELEAEGFTVIPTARAAKLTMDREGIRRFAAEELKVPVSKYKFASEENEFNAAVETIGLPCVVKPVMSSSGKGQSIVRNKSEISKAWQYAISGGRAAIARVIVEEFIPFDYEITLLTVRHSGGTDFMDPIGHLQIDGDYRESWTPQPMSQSALAQAQSIARTVTEGLGGRGIFGVELFVQGDQVYFSEVSPRPHDTGLVTLISQNRSEFALHARAILGLPIGTIQTYGPAASCALLLEGNVRGPLFAGVDRALAIPETDFRLFGKPELHGKRRMGVALALGETIQEAREKAVKAASFVRIV